MQENIHPVEIDFHRNHSVSILPDIGKTLSAIYTYFSQFSGYHISITILSAFIAHLSPCLLPVSNRLVSQSLNGFPELPESLMGIYPVGYSLPGMTQYHSTGVVVHFCTV